MTNRGMCRLGWGLLLALATADTTADAVYKWTDAEGLTHFSAQPPADRQAQQIQVEAPPPTGAAEAKRQPEKAADDGRPKDPADERAEPSAQELARQEEQRRHNCETARHNLETLKTRARVRIHDEQTGEDRYLTPEEHQQWQQDSALHIDEYCTPGNGG